MDYYKEIRNEIINNEINKRIKDFSKNKSDLESKYRTGKLLAEAGKHYGEGIIKEYSKMLIHDVDKKYSYRTLYRIKQFYNFFSDKKVSTMSTQLSWSHYTELLSIKDENKLMYYLNLAINQNIDVRGLREKIKNKEYERLPEDTKLKIIAKGEIKVTDEIKNPIIIKNTNNYEEISEKILQKLILEDIPSFLKELGSGFTFIENEYKIKLGDRYNYIDLLLYNIKYKCYVVVELKVTELKKEYIGQIHTYMNYIDKNIKTIYEDKTIGIIICKKDNKYVMEYCSDNRITSKEYQLI